MTFSMTAFARAERSTDAGAITWELRAVNHRYLELSLKLPDELRALETAVREAVGKRLGRGKIDCSLRFRPLDTASALTLDAPLVARLRELERQLRAHIADALPMRTADYLRWPGALITPTVDSEALQAAALAALGTALDDLVATRAREGARLEAMIVERLDQLAEILRSVRAVLPEIAPQYRARLQARLAELALNPERLEQEIVVFAQRIDISEELDRLDAHVAEARRVLRAGGQVGRRLDFLMQEFNREANTIASKASDLRVTQAAMELKVLIEQMREQVQNIE